MGRTSCGCGYISSGNLYSCHISQHSAPPPFTVCELCSVVHCTLHIDIDIDIDAPSTLYNTYSAHIILHCTLYIVGKEFNMYIFMSTSDDFSNLHFRCVSHVVSKEAEEMRRKVKHVKRKNGKDIVKERRREKNVELSPPFSTLFYFSFPSFLSPVLSLLPLFVLSPFSFLHFTVPRTVPSSDAHKCHLQSYYK